jgi:hypothetical protein
MGTNVIIFKSLYTQSNQPEHIFDLIKPFHESTVHTNEVAVSS